MRRGKLAPLRLGCGFGLDEPVDLGEGKAGGFGKPPARLVFGREGWWLAGQAFDLDGGGAERRFEVEAFAFSLPAVDRSDAHTERGGLAEEEPCYRLLLRLAANDRKHDPWAALFHLDGCEPDIGGAGFEHLVAGVGEHFAGHVVDVGLDEQHLSRVPCGPLAEPNAEDVRPPLDLAGTRAVAGALERYCGPLEARQCSRYRGARGRDEPASFAVGEH